MIYDDKSVPGQEIHEARMVKEGIVHYLNEEDLLLYEEENDPLNRKRLVVTKYFNGIPNTPRTKHGVAVDVHGEWRLLRRRWGSAAEAKAAADAISSFVESNRAAAIEINFEKEPARTQEDDPEAYDRDYYEDNGLRRPRYENVQVPERDDSFKTLNHIKLN